MSTRDSEVLVIGAGPGGYHAAIRAAQLNLDVTLVERDFVGGNCLARGCIPSKALISSVDQAYDLNQAEERGIYADLSIEFHELVDWKDGIVSDIGLQLRELCELNGIELIKGVAEFTDLHKVRISEGERSLASEFQTFDNAIVATGSRPTKLEGFEFDGTHVLDSSHLLSLEEMPRSLLIIGAGYISMEFATMLSKLGTKVVVVAREGFDSMLRKYEDDIGILARERAQELGVEFHAGTPRSWEQTGDGVSVTVDAPDGETLTFGVEHILVAIGRDPVVDTIALDKAGLETNDAGFIETDDQARSDVEHIFAIGDVTGEPMLAHKAHREGIVAAEAIAGESTTVGDLVVPSVVFTEPEIGTVGLTEAEAEAAGHDPIVGQMPFHASGRAHTLEKVDGFIRVVAERSDGTVLGAQGVGPKASELIAELTFAVQLGASVDDLHRTVHTHPTLSETVMEAAAAARDQAIHKLN